MELNSVRERFQSAVEILVDENALLKDRLLVAYASQLAEIRPKTDLPSEVADDFRWLRYALSDADMPFGYGERAAKKLDEMSDEEAAEVARTIFSIFLRMRSPDSVAAT